MGQSRAKVPVKSPKKVKTEFDLPRDNETHGGVEGMVNDQVMLP